MRYTVLHAHDAKLFIHVYIYILIIYDTHLCSHGRFSQGGDKLIESLDPLEFLVITNTLPHRDANGQLFERQPGGKVSIYWCYYKHALSLSFAVAYLLIVSLYK
jgi:hypothetical protein